MKISEHFNKLTYGLLFIFLISTIYHDISLSRHSAKNQKETIQETAESSAIISSIAIDEQNESEGKLSHRVLKNGKYRYLKKPVTSLKNNSYYLSKFYKQLFTLNYKSHSPPLFSL